MPLPALVNAIPDPGPPLTTPVMLVAPLLVTERMLPLALSATLPVSARSLDPEIPSVVAVKLMLLPTVRAPPAAKTAPLLAPIVSAPVPIGPEVSAPGVPTESTPRPIEPSFKLVPPLYVLAAFIIVLPP